MSWRGAGPWTRSCDSRSVSKAIAEAENVAIETVLSSDKFIPVVRAARRRGYLTRLIYIGLPSVELAIERVAGGGHDVPKAKIRSRWSRTHAMFALIRDEVDDVIVIRRRGSRSFVAPGLCRSNANSP